MLKAKSNKSRRKCIQYFIQHFLLMLDEMLDGNLNVGWAVLFTVAHSHPTLSSNILRTIHSSKIQNGGHTCVCTSNHFEWPNGFWWWKTHGGKTRRWVKRRSDRGYFNSIIKELRVEDPTGFKDMFRMDVADFECILTQIPDLISPKHRLGGTDPIGLCLKNDFFVFWLWKKNIRTFEIRSIVDVLHYFLCVLIKRKTFEHSKYAPL